ncbi:putative basic proline-rich protein-like [Iris pallida]|uniref:Basic proline-rich protein-like n=1 Tax=Iris pallida TaxID=29817 RepID=A0AAX6F7D1_IRIPA|nr:putative basic proline-rich protein-like [Iris pallida]
MVTATFGFWSAVLGPTVVLAADGTVVETVDSGPIGSTAAAGEEGSLVAWLTGEIRRLAAGGVKWPVADTGSTSTPGPDGDGASGIVDVRSRRCLLRRCAMLARRHGSVRC